MLKRIVKNESVAGLHEIVVHISLTPEEISGREQISISLNLSMRNDGETVSVDGGVGVGGGMSLSSLCRDFMSFAEGYARSDYRMVRSCARWFERFCNEAVCAGAVLSHEVCEDYRDFLYRHLHGNTPGNYFKK